MRAQVAENADIAAVQVLWVLETDLADSVTAPVPPELQKLLDQFSRIFATQVELPPSRSCDHEIPLIVGA